LAGRPGNLDIGTVLALLNGLAVDETAPPGPRFETFVYADRVLGLDLPRDIGRSVTAGSS